jgi:hypothetical protein
MFYLHRQCIEVEDMNEILQMLWRRALVNLPGFTGIVL